MREREIKRERERDLLAYVTKKFRARSASDTAGSRGSGDAFRMRGVSLSHCALPWVAVFAGRLCFVVA